MASNNSFIATAVLSMPALKALEAAHVCAHCAQDSGSAQLMHFTVFQRKCTGLVCLQVWPGALRTKTQWRLTTGALCIAPHTNGKEVFAGKPFVEKEVPGGKTWHA